VAGVRVPGCRRGGDASRQRRRSGCNDLFICPPSFVMDVQNDSCFCKPN
jgi:hypothetical protein